MYIVYTHNASLHTPFVKNIRIYFATHFHRRAHIATQ